MGMEVSLPPLDHLRVFAVGVCRADERLQRMQELIDARAAYPFFDHCVLREAKTLVSR